ncbi:MAG: hypothetical protein ABI594_11875 [Ginsengibacter sp.]
MKKLKLFFAGLSFIVLSFGAKAQTQTPADYFVGKWSVQVEGTPQGDGKMTVMLERKDGKLDGTIITKAGADSAKITKVEEKEKSVTLYFNTTGYDVNLTMEKKDDDHVTGNVMDMFDATGERVAEMAPKQQ